ncbi:hypothetical protein IRJ41_022537 [Triplophysa rosa]|uniref:LRAT domain-containing protein n=1 Tax=Triplophysa rosa TaxID=992332 RepID=A0A9W7X178_TRIRA|nr:hypothetical protein IRJ41_022537 [Triplophysa rosa]
MKWKEIQFLMSGTDRSYQLIKKCDAPCDDDIKNAIYRLRTGDLILRKIESFVSLFYHVGLYDGRRVIEFSAPSNATFCTVSTSYSSSGENGSVSMRSVRNFIGQQPYRILRIRTAIPKNFSEDVDNAMDYAGIYQPLTNNCLHFALRLLGFSCRAIPNSLQNETEECNMAEGETINLTTRCERE